jgi:hypothetical protein
MNAAGRSQRVTIAPIERPASVSSSHGVGRAAASPIAASIARRAGAENPSRARDVEAQDAKRQAEQRKRHPADHAATAPCRTPKARVPAGNGITGGRTSVRPRARSAHGSSTGNARRAYETEHRGKRRGGPRRAARRAHR